MRLPIGSVLVVRLAGVVDRHPMASRVVSVRAGGVFDCQTTVHRTGMQLPRLDHTDGEPDSEYAGESSEEPITPHGSNIW